MARARNLKPDFFRDAELVECPFWMRLLFAGLWTVADRDGRLVDRPKQIKMDLFPADDVDIESGLSELATRRFIVRYEVGGARYIQIVNFGKHQNPHIKEPASAIPAPGEHGASTGQEPGLNGSGPADSGFPQTDSGFPQPAAGSARVRATEPASRGTIVPDDFTPNANCERVAAELGLRDEIDLQRQRFVDYSKAEGKRYKDAQAAFANWLRKEVLIRRERSGRGRDSPAAWTAWLEVRSVLAFEAEHGRWPEQKPTDPALLAAVEAIGGWRQIQDNDIHRGQFTRAYAEFARVRA